MIFDGRRDQEGCKLPPLVPNCLDPSVEDVPSQVDIEAAMHMQNASVVLDVQMMNSPMCTYTEKEHCTYVFQPVYADGQRAGDCTREFRVCYRGWDCYMR